MDGNEPKSEALPAGWVDHQLRYVYQGRLYLLQGTSLDDGIMINLIRVDERTTSMIQLNSRTVLRRTGSIDDMIPNNKEVVKQIKEQLIDKVIISSKSKDSGSQTAPQEAQRTGSATRFIDPPEPARSLPGNLGLGPGRFGGGLGSDDLDPLAGIGGPRFGPGGSFNPIGPLGGGGGMLFQPPGRFDQPRGGGGVPHGSIPPGARFDPFRPPDVDGLPPRRRPRPDNDEMPPPGFDDMYM